MLLSGLLKAFMYLVNTSLTIWNFKSALQCPQPAALMHLINTSLAD